MGFFSVVISRVISPLIWVISIVTLLITLLFTTPAGLRRVAWSALRGCEALELSGAPQTAFTCQASLTHLSHLLTATCHSGCVASEFPSLQD